jgi:hypothetical protein
MVCFPRSHHTALESRNVLRFASVGRHSSGIAPDGRVLFDRSRRGRRVSHPNDTAQRKSLQCQTFVLNLSDTEAEHGYIFD